MSANSKLKPERNENILGGWGVVIIISSNVSSTFALDGMAEHRYPIIPFNLIPFALRRRVGHFYYIVLNLLRLQERSGIWTL